MTNSTTSKFVAAAVGFALALTVFVGVGAASAGAQAMTLSQLVDLFISLGIISADKAAAAKAAVSSSASAYSFTTDLTVGSTGAAVTALQNAVGVTPATGYFGAITKAAVQKYQAANGISATGFVGPLTRAALNKSGASTPVTPGSTPVVNSGVEGTLTADKASISNSTVYEGDTMHTVLGIKLQARLSDINVQRVRLDLGADTTVYTKAFKTMYLTDDSGRVLAQADSNSNTVVKDSGEYVLTFGGFNYTVARDATKYLWVKADAYSSFKTSGTGNCASTVASCSISLVSSDAVRGTDGAGFDQFAGTNAVTQSLTLNGSLIDTATLDLSTDAANVKTGDVVASGGANNNEADQVPVLVFDLRANKDSLKITDITATITSTTDLATATTAYLYEGSNLIQTESVTGASVIFADIDNLYVSKDTTKALTIKIDVRSATATPDTFLATVTDVRSENSLGTTVNDTSSAVGENQIVRNAGPVFTLLSKNITVSGVNSNGSTQSTSTVSATFALKIDAVGSDVYFANQASSTNKMFAFKLYNSAGSDLTGTSGYATSSEGFTIPSNGVTTIGTTEFKLAKGSSVTISPIQVDVKGKLTTTDLPIAGIAVAIDKIFWSLDSTATTSSTFMSGKTEWRTNIQNP